VKPRVRVRPVYDGEPEDVTEEEDSEMGDDEVALFE